MNQSTPGPLAASSTCTYQYQNGSHCGRPVHEHETVCFWHSKHANKHAPEIKSQLEEMSKQGVDMEGFILKGVNLFDVYLIGAKMKRVNLSRANLENGHLFEIDLEGADLFKTNFENSNLKHAHLRDANVMGTRFNGAKLERIDWGPHEKLLCEREGYAARKAGDFENAMVKFLEAEDAYRAIKNNYKDRGIASHGGKFFYREMIMKRMQIPLWSLERFYSLLLDLSCGYGEKPFRIISFSIAFIFFNAIIYCAMGISYSGDIQQWSAHQSIIENFTLFMNAVYFSTITFTTVGYGDFLPMTVTERLIAGLEAYTGAFLMSLFVITVYKNMMER